nr:(2Fe-2S)-binding protein [Pararoseomonas baculiformis]
MNGTPAVVEAPEGMTLLQALRGPLGLSGPRFGCGQEACGSCYVTLDGEPRASCTLPVEAAAGRAVGTVEGLGRPEAPHPLQSAFLAEQAGQCGYCLSGILVSAAALLARNPAPDEAAVRAALEPHLCRCGAHNRMIRAVLRAARVMRGEMAA